jgi:hypothetical protein
LCHRHLWSVEILNPISSCEPATTSGKLTRLNQEWIEFHETPHAGVLAWHVARNFRVHAAMSDLSPQDLEPLRRAAREARSDPAFRLWASLSKANALVLWAVGVLWLVWTAAVTWLGRVTVNDQEITWAAEPGKFLAVVLAGAVLGLGCCALARFLSRQRHQRGDEL